MAGTRPAMTEDNTAADFLPPALPGADLWVKTRHRAGHVGGARLDYNPFADHDGVGATGPPGPNENRWCHGTLIQFHAAAGPRSRSAAATTRRGGSSRSPHPAPARQR